MAERTATPDEASPDPTPAPTSTHDQSGVIVMELAPQPRSFAQLQSEVAAENAGSNARISVSLTELDGYNPQSWNFGGDRQIVAASTYKLPLLMAEAQLIAAGQAGVNDRLCYQPGDDEAGWFDDYAPGTCFTRSELAFRAGRYSDNTAAHILVRYQGGAPALNAFARAHGARNSAYYDPNLTTTDDLASLMTAESQGRAGGAAAQLWLYPLLTHTAFETGIPAGVPAATVVHKVGALDGTVSDVALVSGGANGPYVLAISIDGPGDAGFAMIAQIASQVWAFEATRPVIPS